MFDAEDQRFYQLEEKGKLIAGCWAMDEGGLDNELTQAIWRGERRPQGNLVAQYLCYQGNLPEACKLKSVRISRIAVQPELQQQGYGKRLVSHIILQIEPLVDFVSVSFGMSESLLNFWKSCDFELVQISPTPEASSGYRSAMMLYPLTEQGRQFLHQAKKQFERDLSLQPFFLELPEHLQKIGKNAPLATEFLTEDHLNLQGFTNAQRSFSACFVSLKRLYLHTPDAILLLKALFNEMGGELPHHKKAWLDKLRTQLKLYSSIVKSIK